MTRLLNPSPGEILDRLSILELKIEFAKRKNVLSTHFEAEKASLQEAMLPWDRSVHDDYHGDEKALDQQRVYIAANKNGLTSMNSLIWAAEDEVRATGENEVFKLARLCKQISRWNDSRALFVSKLNELYGLANEPEKLYSKKAGA